MAWSSDPLDFLEIVSFCVLVIAAMLQAEGLDCFFEGLTDKLPDYLFGDVSTDVFVVVRLTFFGNPLLSFMVFLGFFVFILHGAGIFDFEDQIFFLIFGLPVSEAQETII